MYRQARAEILPDRGSDADGEAVLDLASDEIRVMQGPTICEITTLETDDEGMKIALLVDNSEVSRMSLIPLRAGLEEFLKALPPQHEVALITVGGQARLRVDFTTDREELISAATSLFAETSVASVVLDALIETWSEHFQEEDNWPVFMMVSFEGPDNSGSVQDDEFNAYAGELIARFATVNAVTISSRGGGRGVQIFASTFLTEQTGGQYRGLSAATGLPNVLTEVATEIGNHYDHVKDRYRVGYTCTPDNPDTPIEVLLARQGLAASLFPDRKLPEE